MSSGLRSAIVWGAVALVAAALNLATGTACCKAKYHRPAAEWRRRLTGPILETEPNDDERTPGFFGEARDESRTRFEGTCAGGTPDVFHIGVVQGKVGVVVEIHGTKGATLHAPEAGVTAAEQDDRIELHLPRDHFNLSVYLRIPCDGGGAGAYEGWYTAMRPPR